jgi:nucleoside phosphorylase
VADSVVVHDFGIHTEGGFQHLGFYNHHRPDGLHYLRALPANSELLAATHQSVKNIKWSPPSPQIHTGCLASGDQIIADNDKKQWLQHTFNALAVDMESAAMAQVAQLNEIPWLAVRAISDQADSTLDIDLSNFITVSDEPEQSQSTLRKVITLAKKPGQIKTAFQIRRAVQRAAAHAAQATATIVTHLENPFSR